ncbi:MAG: sigma-70 family RNA polymerase sigma factor [Planctomycetaceae bacterium]|nr:sigma-70 family RNA polymerase sigma factor [Planctomycetaceae bacterium]
MLIEKSRSGDRDSFGQIVRQYQGIVSGIIYGILGDFHKSEDIAQETFLIAWKKLDELRDMEKLPGWLCGIARNLANHHRIRQPKVQTVSVAEAVEIAEKKDDPARILAQSEQNRLIWAALEKIPEKYRIPLVLYYRREESIPEIADALEISKEVLSMRLTRARKYLRRELEKQVEGAIAANGPGEFFSLAVIAALPAAMTLSTGNAVAATALGTTAGAKTTFAASAMVVAPKSGPSGTTLFGASIFGVPFFVLLEIISATLFIIVFILGAIPGLWFSVRNAPTLRTRRYLILCSLRAHLLIAFVCFCSFALMPTCRGIFTVMVHYGIMASDLYILNMIASLILILLLLCVTLFILVSPWVYRRILREDTGLAVPKKTVPLEESSLSIARLEKTYKRFSRTCLVMLIGYFASLIFGIFLVATGIYKSFDYLWDAHPLVFSFLVIGVIFYVTFRQFHKRLLATAKDETTFHAAGPVWDRHKTPIVEKVFVEWLVYLGCFVAAGLIVAKQSDFGFGYTYPIPLSLKLILVLAGSMMLAAINAVYPRLRWLVILGGSFLVGYGIKSIYWTYLDRGKYDILWLDSPSQWPLLFTIIWLNIYVMTVTFITLILGALHYYAKWNGKAIRFSLPKKIIACWCIMGAILLCFAPHWYSSFRVPYWYNRYVFTKADNAQKIEMCNEMIRLSPENSFFHIKGTGSRGYQYAQMKEYALALADYDAVIRLNEKQPETENSLHEFRVYHGSRGNVKFALDDLHGAIADYTVLLDGSPRSCNTLYNRGYAYEKLGETEKATADYTAALEIVEDPSLPTWRWIKFIDSAVSRPECNDPNRVSIVELREIRDRLKQESHQ